jgi:hypothetical protein
MIDYLKILGDDKHPSLFSSREKEFYDKDNQLVRTSSDVEVPKTGFSILKQLMNSDVVNNNSSNNCLCSQNSSKYKQR